MPLAAARLLVLRPRATDVGEWRRFGDGHVPPGFAPTDALVAIHGNHDDAHAVARPRIAEGGLDFGARRGEYRVRAHRGGVGREVDTDGQAVELARIAPPLIARTEPVAADGLRQTTDAGEALVVEHEYRQLHFLLHGSGDLLRHHQVRAVTNHDVHVAVRPRHPDAQTASDLVPHARVSVFEVIATRGPRPP